MANNSYQCDSAGVTPTSKSVHLWSVFFDCLTISQQGTKVACVQMTEPRHVLSPKILLFPQEMDAAVTDGCTVFRTRSCAGSFRRIRHRIVPSVHERATHAGLLAAHFYNSAGVARVHLQCSCVV